MKLWQKIGTCVAAAEVLGGVGGFITAKAIDGWYDTLVGPPGTPPNWVFGPAWTALYAMVGTSFALVWHDTEPGPERKKAFAVFGTQFALNMAWTPVFFGAHQLGGGLVVIGLMLVGIAANIVVFRPINRTAAALLVPYLGWVSYATYLNAGYWWLNR